MIELNSLNEVLTAQLQGVDRWLEEQLTSDSAVINEAVLALVKAGGKRVRPLLTLLAAQYGQCDQQIVEIATMPEVIHMATLIHDDIIDMADTRRGVPAMHRRYGSDVAVFAGDLLLVSTTHRMLSFYSLASYRQFSTDLMAILNAEILQMSERQRWQTTLKTYLRIIEGKTARLLKLSVKLGTHYAAVDDYSARLLVKIAHHLGIAFQIIDDCLDYIGQADRVGKPLYRDLANGYMTLPIILKCSDDPAFRAELADKRGKLAERHLQRIMPAYVGAALDIAERYSLRAKSLVERLPNRDYNAIWFELIDLLLKRRY